MALKQRTGSELVEQANAIIRKGDLTPGDRSLAGALLTIAAERFRKEGTPEKAHGLFSRRSNLLGSRTIGDYIQGAEKPEGKRE